MDIKLVSHASVIVRAADDTRIWTDPWLVGKAFNDSWTLFPEPSWDPADLDAIDYLWISHEHPDHFHIPTLRSLPAAFKERVTVLFQRNNSEKMFDAFRRFGFRNCQTLPHRERVRLTGKCEVYSYQEGLMNSCLAVLSDGKTIFNVNDAEIRGPDCKLIVQDIGKADVVLNQFSIAGYSGLPDRERRLRALAKSILENVVSNHVDLGARVTIPFASFVYFSCEDNRYINDFANTVHDLVAYAEPRNVDIAVLFPGDVFELDKPHANGPALQKFETAYRDLRTVGYAAPVPVDESDLKSAFLALSEQLRDRYPTSLLASLEPVRLYCPDLDARFECHFGKGYWARLGSHVDVDVEVNSQPLHFALKFPYGVQTLGVSGRMRLLRGEQNWKKHRILFALNNAEFYLKPRHLLSRNNAQFVRTRLRGGLSQVHRRLLTMM